MCTRVAALQWVDPRVGRAGRCQEWAPSPPSCTKKEAHQKAEVSVSAGCLHNISTTFPDMSHQVNYDSVVYNWFTALVCWVFCLGLGLSDPNGEVIKSWEACQDRFVCMIIQKWQIVIKSMASFLVLPVHFEKSLKHRSLSFSGAQFSVKLYC